MEYKKYKKEDTLSYCFGGFPTYELLKNKPEHVREIIIHDTLQDNEQSREILKLAKKHNIKISTNSKLIEKLSQKGNVFIIGVFEKYTQKINTKENQSENKPTDFILF